MRQRFLPLALACGSLFVALSAGAEVYTIRLANGTIFESRYQPKQATWDPKMVTFLTETGLEVALPQGLIADVSAQSETKGFGKVINTTTVDLGFAPNDLDQTQQMLQQQAVPFSMLAGQPAGSNMFVEPSAAGTGIPVGFGGYGGFGAAGTGTSTPGGFTPPSTGTPAPFTTPTTTTTPAPFTTPTPASATPTAPSTGQQ
jgi:hypothetical protein